MNNGNIDIKGELDGGWNSYYDPEEHGSNMSQTVHGTSDDDLHSEETVSLPSEVDENNLNKRQKDVIEGAVIHTDKTSYELGEIIEEDDSYIRQTLRSKCPEWYNNRFKDKSSYNPMDTTELREFIESQDGVSKAEIAEHFDKSKQTVGNHLKELEEEGKIRAETGIEGYHALAKVYYPKANESVEDAVSTEKVDFVQEDNVGEVPENPDWDMPAENVTVDKPEYEQPKPINIAIEAMKATAENKETVNALEVVESYL